MKIVKLGEPRIIIEAPHEKYNNFGFPTLARLQNGKLAVVASGFRRRLMCPFGKVVISYSSDEGHTYTPPTVVLDTPLDNPCPGIATFGKSGVIITTFSHSVAASRSWARDDCELDYLGSISPEEEKRYLGGNFIISQDFGESFGEIQISPISSPHGPVELSDGTLLWVGWKYDCFDGPTTAETKDAICAYKIFPDGRCEYLGAVDELIEDGYPLILCEPHTIELDGGRLITHLRTQSKRPPAMFTISQCESVDSGRTWSTPRKLMRRMGGSPPHLLKHSSGALICTYGCRDIPYGVKVMISLDSGETWELDHEIYISEHDSSMGYPASIERSDGSILTVFYSKAERGGPSVIMQQVWQLEKDSM